MWKSIQINIQNIEVTTDKAVLINCPNKSDYTCFSFWHPAKLVRTGKHTYARELSYTDDFQFKLVKYGNGKYNSKQIIQEIHITIADFENMFKDIDENTKERIVKDEYETHKPKSLNPVERNADDEFID